MRGDAHARAVQRNPVLESTPDGGSVLVVDGSGGQAMMVLGINAARTKYAGSQPEAVADFGRFTAAGATQDSQALATRLG